MALWQIRTRIRDEPGTLAKLAAALGRLKGNIVSVDIHSVDVSGTATGAGMPAPPGGAARAHDDLYVDVPEQLDADSIRAALPRQATAEDLDRTRLRPAKVADLVDGQSRALDLMARLATNPAALPSLLCRLIGGDHAELTSVRPADSPHQVVVAVPWHRATPTDDTIGHYIAVRRDWAPFSQTERMRADRFVAAAAAIESERVKVGTRAILADGTEIRIQLGTPNDKGHIGDLIERCGPGSRTPAEGASPDELPDWPDSLTMPPGGFTVLAFADVAGQPIPAGPRAPASLAGPRPAAQRALAEPAASSLAGPSAFAGPSPLAGSPKAAGPASGAGPSSVAGSPSATEPPPLAAESPLAGQPLFAAQPSFTGTSALAGTSVLVGMAQCLPEDEPGRSEVSVLVADAWQRRGIGTLLIRSVVRQALICGTVELTAISAPGTTGLQRLFARTGLCVSVRDTGGIQELRARLLAPEPQYARR